MKYDCSHTETLFNQSNKNAILVKIDMQIKTITFFRKFIKPYSEEHQLAHLLTHVQWYVIVYLDVLLA